MNPKIDKRYPTTKPKKKLTSIELDDQIREYEARHGPIELSPIEYRGKQVKCARNGCNNPPKKVEKDNTMGYYCSQKCSQRAKRETDWSARIRSAN